MQNIIKNTIEFFKYNKEERIARYMVRSYWAEHNVQFAKEKNGTVRFYSNIVGVQGFYRIRKNKMRPIAGEAYDSFSQIHCGKITIAIEAPKGRDVWNFSVSAEK